MAFNGSASSPEFPKATLAVNFYAEYYYRPVKSPVLCRRLPIFNLSPAPPHEIIKLLQRRKISLKF